MDCHRLLKYYSFIIILIISNNQVNAHTIYVNSNADSGPGTLREAIERANANGISEKDSILFSLPGTSEPDRTIILQTMLPHIWGNVIIDGTTQNGIPIGKSDARVALVVNTLNNAFYHFFEFLAVKYVEVYGLMFHYDFYVNGSFKKIGITYDRSSDIIIGRPGKGNYFLGLSDGISNSGSRFGGLDFSRNVVIQSNLFNVDKQGFPSLYTGVPGKIYNPMTYAIDLHNTIGLTIGGNLEGEGNTTNAQHLYVGSSLGGAPGFALIAGNKLNVPVDGITVPGPYPQIEIKADGGGANGTPYEVTIENNLIHGTVYMYTLGAPFYIRRNFIFDNTNSTPQDDYRIIVERCQALGMIGGDLSSDGNTIYSTRQSLAGYHKWQLDQGSIYVRGNKGVTIRNNVMYCNGYYGSTVFCTLDDPDRIPFVKIQQQNAQGVSGKATPGTVIDLYYDDECSACEGKSYIGKVIAGLDSLWSFSGNITGTVVATATDQTGYTSGFTAPLTDASKIRVIQPSCAKPNGAITGMLLSGTWDHVEWHQTYEVNGVPMDSVVINNSTNLLNVGPGTYYFIAKYGETCKSARIQYQLVDQTIKIDTRYLSVQQPSCGLSNGAITGLLLINGDGTLIEWKTETGTVISNDLNLTTLNPGKYKLVVTNLQSGCADSSVFYDLQNQAGPSLNAGAASIKGTTCGQSNGSITHLVTDNVSGQPFIEWRNNKGAVVTTGSIDLLDVPAGSYQLVFKDLSPCDTIKLSFDVPVLTPGITIDISRMEVHPGGCIQPTGAIIGIQVSGALSYRWVDDKGQTASTQLSATNLDTGAYQLIISNSYCEQRTEFIHVPLNKPVLDKTSLNVLNDECSLNTGSIQGLHMVDKSGIAPFTYHWTDAFGRSIGSQPDINQLPAGRYQLSVTDQAGCTDSLSIDLQNRSIAFNQPIYKEVIIPRLTMATFSVTNPQQGTYQLLNQPDDPFPITENPSGTFTTPAISHDKYYYVRVIKGSCTSPLAVVTIRTIDKTEIYVPSAFSPNGDGKNDFLKPVINGYLSNYHFVVFNRWGGKVFQTDDNTKAWDGMVKGIRVASGTYVWILSGTDIFGNSFRRQGSFVLIR